ncbi:unnamed protein product [Ascophyllum nodosum]
MSNPYNRRPSVPPWGDNHFGDTRGLAPPQPPRPPPFPPGASPYRSREMIYRPPSRVPQTWTGNGGMVANRGVEMQGHARQHIEMGGRLGQGRRRHQEHRRQTRARHSPHPQPHLPQQQVYPPRLHTTGGRPWTMYPSTPQAAPGSSAGGSSDAAASVTAAAGPQQRRKGTQLTVVSYNVLADSLISFDYIPYCRAWNDAAWKARPRRILDKIMEFQPDVVCLQEVDKTNYLGIFKPTLETVGYEGAYCQRSGSKVDGCATFVLGRRVSLVEQKNVNYKVEGHPVLDRDNVALLVVLDIPSQDHPVGSETCSDAGETSSGGHSDGKAPPSQESAKGETSEHPPVATTVSAAGGPVDGSVKGAGAVADECSAVTSDSPVERGDTGGELAASSAEGRGCARVVVANTHLLFNPKRGDVKTAQLMMLTRSVERLAESSRANGVIICGDFNMTPHSALYHYMVKGELNVDGLSRFTVSSQSQVSGCGTLPRRSAGVKHQGGGCVLGSFEPTSMPTLRGGGRGRGRGRKRSRDGRRLRDGGAPQARQLCEACSNRPPHAASSTYVATPAQSPTPDGEALKTDVGVDAPPGATPGALFAVMDPSSCGCKADVISVRDADRVQDDEGAVGDGEGEELDGELPAAGARSKDSATSKNDKADHLPPVLWPPRASVASSREFGPVAHCLRLRSAYAQQPDAWGTGEPAFTSYHHLFKGTVDYVFYGPGPAHENSNAGRGGDDRRKGGDGGALERATPGRLRCLGVAEPPMKSDLDRFIGLPSPEEPSDHILLAVRFEVTPS